jgi:hypothetical protein
VLLQKTDIIREFAQPVLELIFEGISSKTNGANEGLNWIKFFLIGILAQMTRFLRKNPRTMLQLVSFSTEIGEFNYLIESLICLIMMITNVFFPFQVRFI